MIRKNKQKDIDATETAVDADVDATVENAVGENATGTETELEAIDADVEDAGTDLSKAAPSDRSTEGPLDEAEANSVRPYIDLGGVKILPREGLNLRLEVEESTKRIVAVGLDYAGSTLQIQPFAAPRSTGLWNETRVQIQEQIAKQGGTVTERDGVFGPELVAEVPVVQGSNGAAGMRIARFVGVDGPRWFLRGVIAGEGATDPDAAAKVEDLFRSIVVVRGSAPMPPRDLIPLRMPASATPAT
ncbi:MAG TPA: DUF3710 domain-containing protein [Mycetocola sp.]|jgi:hypothetical protein|nr:DUF3710 domain-containing protein [Mycetocola sp.]